MAHLVALAWDGTGLHGAAEAEGVRTVAGVLREGLARVGADGVAIDVLSRTDAGVHAREGLFVLQGLPDRTLASWWGALVHQLPDDVRPVRVAALPDPPRVAVVDKSYRYTIDASHPGDPFLAPFAWRVSVPWDGLVAAAAVVRGRVSFESFRRRDDTREDLTRTITHAAWARQGTRWDLTVRGDGFPMRGVRALVGAIVHVARGHATPEDLAACLGGQPHALARQQAPARGLCLMETTLREPPDWFGEDGFGESGSGNAGSVTPRSGSS